MGLISTVPRNDLGPTPRRSRPRPLRAVLRPPFQLGQYDAVFISRARILQLDYSELDILYGIPVKMSVMVGSTPRVLDSSRQTRTPKTTLNHNRLQWVKGHDWSIPNQFNLRDTKLVTPARATACQGIFERSIPTKLSHVHIYSPTCENDPI